MSEWRDVSTLPADGEKVDVWMHIYASPRSFGMSDEFRLIDCWREDGQWVHFYKGKVEPLHGPYVTLWMPAPESPK